MDSRTKITVLSELAEKAFQRNEILRCARALDKIDRMLLNGSELPDIAGRSKSLVALFGNNPILRIPLNLKREVMGAVTAKQL